MPKQKKLSADNLVHFPSETEGENAEAAETAETDAERHSKIPGAMVGVIMRFYILSAVVLILTVICTALERDSRYLVCLPISVALIGAGQYIRWKCLSGRVEERAMRFVQGIRQHTKCKIVFEDAEGKHHDFYVSKNCGDDFIPHGIYLIYTYKGAPNQLVSWELL